MSKSGWVKNAFAVIGIFVVIGLSIVVWHPDTSLGLTLLILFSGMAVFLASLSIWSMFASPESLLSSAALERIVNVKTGQETVRWSKARTAQDYQPLVSERAARWHPWLTLAITFPLTGWIAWFVLSSADLGDFQMRLAFVALAVAVTFPVLVLVVFNLLIGILKLLRI